MVIRLHSTPIRDLHRQYSWSSADRGYWRHTSPTDVYDCITGPETKQFPGDIHHLLMYMTVLQAQRPNSFLVTYITYWCIWLYYRHRDQTVYWRHTSPTDVYDCITGPETKQFTGDIHHLLMYMTVLQAQRPNSLLATYITYWCIWLYYRPRDQTVYWRHTSPTDVYDCITGPETKQYVAEQEGDSSKANVSRRYHSQVRPGRLK